MVQVLHDDMSREEIAEAVFLAYGGTSNWESYEKDYGAGAVADRPAWIWRDKGSYARQALSLFMKAKGQTRNDLIATAMRDYIADVNSGTVTAEQAYHRMVGVVGHHDGT